jgi:hypothetical protein
MTETLVAQQLPRSSDGVFAVVGAGELAIDHSRGVGIVAEVDRLEEALAKYSVTDGKPEQTTAKSILLIH